MDKDLYFSSLVAECFEFLIKDYQFEMSIEYPLEIHFRSEKILLSIERETRSGWIGLEISTATGEMGVSLEEIAGQFGGALEDYESGLYAYEDAVAAKCLQKLAEKVKTHLHKLLLGDLDELQRLHTVAQESRRLVLADMQFGGLRTRAHEAWDRGDSQEYLRVTDQIEPESLTDSEVRRRRMARIRLSTKS
ncbi:hypothetical protein SAMN06297251_101459 [Fulvimarina manganoxydans]|uniref:Uncharacterized protein n=1 Tax=Fulvimarina manganoxydans TaxID=937218 RepID=A0A1W1YM04_9HYPH|nr:hypothetical protein [Fulvimarina manganoxydans]SMC37162.1 hypothetical protein SAMN06297251_101459 [Fulvimarina manganoxydans]